MWVLRVLMVFCRVCICSGLVFVVRWCVVMVLSMSGRLVMWFRCEWVNSMWLIWVILFRLRLFMLVLVLIRMLLLSKKEVVWYFCVMVLEYFRICIFICRFVWFCGWFKWFIWF